MDELAKDARVAEAYEIWQELQEQKCLDYNEQLPERVPLSQQKEFKMVRNMVIREALKLSQRPVASAPAQHIEIVKAPVQVKSASALAESVDNTVESNGERLDAPSATPDVGTPLRQEQTASEPAPAVRSPVKPNDYPLTTAASAVRMLHHMGNIFREVTVRDSTYGSLLIDRQRRKELQELRGALGHPEDDREDETLYHVNDPQAMR